MKWNLWSPFQPPEVRDTCEHLTEEEERILTQKAGQAGLWIAFTIALPCATGISLGKDLGWKWYTAGMVILLIVGIIGLFLMRMRTIRFMCETNRGREQGYDPQAVTPFSWRLKKKESQAGGAYVLPGGPRVR